MKHPHPNHRSLTTDTSAFFLHDAADSKAREYFLYPLRFLKSIFLFEIREALPTVMSPTCSPDLKRETPRCFQEYGFSTLRWTTSADSVKETLSVSFEDNVTGWGGESRLLAT